MRYIIPILLLAAFFGMFAPAASAQSGYSRPAQEWLTYYKGDGGFNYRDVAKFMAAHPDFPAMTKISREAESAMPSNLQDIEIINWFTKYPPQTSGAMKAYERALVRAGRNTDARRAVNEWWRNANLSKEEQKAAYVLFQAQFDQRAHQERLRNMIFKSQYTNARALAQTLGGGYLPLAEARISLREGKSDSNAWLARVPSNLQGDEGLMFDRLVWRRKADMNDGAIEILKRSPSSDGMYDPEGWGKERSIIVRRLFEERKYAQAYRLSADHKIKDGSAFATNEWMAGWLALEYLNKPWEGFQHFEKLYHNVGTPISKSRAAYWAGLASERLGHPEIAAKWYDAGAQFGTTFYGQLAAEKGGKRARIDTANINADAATRNGTLGTAARYLKENGYGREAAIFINKMIENAKTPQQFAAVSDLARSLSFANLSIKAAQESEKVTGVQLTNHAYPKVEKYMQGAAPVEWALIHSLIRQESRYDDQAVSSAGALGLMQLMPATAQEVASKSGISHQKGWLTQRPAHNVALGSRYLRKMLDRYDGNYAMALAAYNAGPGRVDRWIREIGDPRDPRTDLVAWVEMIPIYETRNYVQRVLEGVYVYRRTLSANKGGSGQTHLASK